MPQQMKTDAIDDIPAEELPDLTPQQMRFVEGILSGKTASDAYRAAYDCQNSMARTIWAEASRLRNNPDVAAWLASARKANLQAGGLTVGEHQAELVRLREIALEKGNIGAAVNAEISRGKAQGLYVEQVRDVTEHDPQRTLLEIRQHSPELADQLAREYNIPLPAEQGTTRH